MDMASHDDLGDALAATGQAVGLALATVLAGVLKQNGASLSTVADALAAMSDSERINPLACIVLGSIAEGIEAFPNADPYGDGKIL